MAGQPRLLNVALAPSAIQSLHEIWQWNAEQYGVERADKYAAFLSAQTNLLASKYILGQHVPSFP